MAATAFGVAVARARIRLATVADMDLLVRHRRGMWEEIFDLPVAQLDAADRVYRRWAKRHMQTGRLVGWIVEDASGVALASGCVWLSPQQPRPTWPGLVAPYLMSMYTEPGHRGRGHATRIVRECVRWARRKGYPVVLLHASKLGDPIYRREGFRQSNEMRLPLPRGRR